MLEVMGALGGLATILMLFIVLKPIVANWFKKDKPPQKNFVEARRLKNGRSRRKSYYCGSEDSRQCTISVPMKVPADKANDECYLYSKDTKG